ncbi:MAG: hypothetical protein AAF530_09775 [Pseudomonadota bacterium]
MTDSDCPDADHHFFEYFCRKQRAYIKQVLNDDVIEEYKKSPLGKHSEPLERTLAYFRRLPMQLQYGLIRRADGTFGMIALSGKRGTSPVHLSDTHFETLEDGYFHIFLQQIEDLKAHEDG